MARRSTKKYRIYDVELDIDIDSKLISTLIDMMNQYEPNELSLKKQ